MDLKLPDFKIEDVENKGHMLCVTFVNRTGDFLIFFESLFCCRYFICWEMKGQRHQTQVNIYAIFTIVLFLKIQQFVLVP